MLSIAALASYRNIPFIYYTRYLPKDLEKSLKSNYTQALALGMQLEVLDAESDEALGLMVKHKVSSLSLLIPQGGATEHAKEGIGRLAQEIIQFQQEHHLHNLLVATPSGTGTTALWLDEVLFPQGIQVVTTPVVGDADYLLQQMQKLKNDHHVKIISTRKKYRFGKPDRDLLRQYHFFLQQGIEFDLLYATVMWQALQEHHKELEDVTLLYLHSGGVMGNITQLQRYKSKNINV